VWFRGRYFTGVPVREELLTAMRDRLIHRGPGNGSSWLRDGPRIGPTHRPMSIIDTSHSADQPMATEDGLLRIAFNVRLLSGLDFVVACSQGVAASYTSSCVFTGLHFVRDNGCDAECLMNVASQHRPAKDAAAASVAIFQGGSISDWTTIFFSMSLRACLTGSFVFAVVLLKVTGGNDCSRCLMSGIWVICIQTTLLGICARRRLELSPSFRIR